MPNRAAEIRAAVLAEYPNATVVKRDRHAIHHRVGVDALTGQDIVKAVFGNDLHFDRGNGWEEVETDWRSSGDAGWPDVADRQQWKVESGARGTRRITPDQRRPDEYIELTRPKQLKNGSWANAQFAAKQRQGPTVDFLSDDADVELQVSPGRLKVDFVMKNPNQSYPLRWNMTLVGLIREGLDFRSGSTGEWVGRFEPFTLEDADGVVRDVPMEITDTYVRLDPDVTGLSYPIRVDPTYTANVGDGYLESRDGTSYASALGGTGTFSVNTTSATCLVGQGKQSTTFFVRQGYLWFDTSSIPDDASITDAVLRVTPTTIGTLATHFTLYAGVFGVGGSVTTDDWRTQAQLQALTPLASLETTTLAASTQASLVNDSTTPLAGAVNVLGTTGLVLWSSRNEAGVVPTADEYVSLASSNHTTVAYRPVLDVTYVTDSTAPAVTSGPVHTPSPVGNTNQYTLTFTVDDDQATAISYSVWTGAGGTGTQLISGTASDAVPHTTATITDSGVVEGANTRYLRVSDGTNVGETAFTVVADFVYTYTETSGSVIATVVSGGGNTQSMLSSGPVQLVRAVAAGTNTQRMVSTREVQVVRVVSLGTNASDYLNLDVPEIVVVVVDGIDALDTGGMYDETAGVVRVPALLMGTSTMVYQGVETGEVVVVQTLGRDGAVFTVSSEPEVMVVRFSGGGTQVHHDLGAEVVAVRTFGFDKAVVNDVLSQVTVNVISSGFEEKVLPELVGQVVASMFSTGNDTMVMTEYPGEVRVLVGIQATTGGVLLEELVGDVLLLVTTDGGETLTLAHLPRLSASLLFVDPFSATLSFHRP